MKKQKSITLANNSFDVSSLRKEGLANLTRFLGKDLATKVERIFYDESEKISDGLQKGLLPTIYCDFIEDCIRDIDKSCERRLQSDDYLERIEKDQKEVLNSPWKRNTAAWSSTIETMERIKECMTPKVIEGLACVFCGAIACNSGIAQDRRGDEAPSIKAACLKCGRSWLLSAG